MKRIILTSLFCGYSLSFAGSFIEYGHSASLLGSAYAGTGVVAEDASVLSYNPAGMTHLKNTGSFSFGSNFKNNNYYLTDVFATKNIGGTSVPYTKNEDIKSNSYQPNVHYAYHVLKDFWIGASVTSPYSWRLHYPGDSALRYSATTTDIKSYNINPVVAYQLNDSFAIGVGFNWLYFDIDFDSSMGSNTVEGYQNNTGNAWGKNLNIGLLYNLDSDTRFAISYQSGFYLDLSGKTHQKNPNDGQVSLLKFLSEFDLPPQITFSYFQDLNDEWDVMSDFSWTRWSRFSRLSFRFSDGNYLSTKYHYKNTLRFSLGGAYKWSDTWTVKFGLALDESPVRHQYQTVRIPDANQVWFSLGLNYKMNEKFAFNFGYSLIHFHTLSVRELSPLSSLNLSNTASASYKSNTNLLGVQMTYSIC